MAHLPEEEAAIVVVNQVIQAPELLRHIAGQRITVFHAKKIEIGQRAKFYSEALVFGESIAVEVKWIQPVEAEPAPALADAAGNLHAQRAQERFDAADLVVTGRVKAVHAPEAASVAAAMGSNSSTRITEHDPMWNDAVIEVHEVHKGDAPSGEVVIRFPSSTDVKWYRAPKFQPGQEGVFMLHREEPKALASGAAAFAAVAGAATEMPYTALDPADFHPAEATNVIATVVRNRS